WLNLGDSYAGGGGHYPDAPSSVGGSKHGTASLRGRRTPDGLKDKDMLGIPWAVAFALRADGWFLRSEVIWHRPNALPDTAADRPSRSHQHLFLFARSGRYYFDQAPPGGRRLTTV